MWLKVFIFFLVSDQLLRKELTETMKTELSERGSSTRVERKMTSWRSTIYGVAQIWIWRHTRYRDPKGRWLEEAKIKFAAE